MTFMRAMELIAEQIEADVRRGVDDTDRALALMNYYSVAIRTAIDEEKESVSIQATDEGTP